MCADKNWHIKIYMHKNTFIKIFLKKFKQKNKLFFSKKLIYKSVFFISKNYLKIKKKKNYLIHKSELNSSDFFLIKKLKPP